MTEEPVLSYREFKQKHKLEQEQWHQEILWFYVKVLIIVPAAFLVGIAIGFAWPA